MANNLSSHRLCQWSLTRAMSGLTVARIENWIAASFIDSTHMASPIQPSCGTTFRLTGPARCLRGPREGGGWQIFVFFKHPHGEWHPSFFYLGEVQIPIDRNTQNRKREAGRERG